MDNCKMPKTLTLETMPLHYIGQAQYKHFDLWLYESNSGRKYLVSDWNNIETYKDEQKIKDCTMIIDWVSHDFVLSLYCIALQRKNSLKIF